MIRDGYIIIEENEVYYNIINERYSGDNVGWIVVLHEGLGSVAQWKEIPLEISNITKRPVLVYDRIGHGKSSFESVPRKSNFMQFEAEVILPNLIKHFTNSQKISLIGHSDGATIALIYGGLYPDSVEFIVAESAHVVAEELTFDSIKKLKDLLPKSNLISRLEKYHGSKANALFQNWSDVWLSDSFASFNICDGLKKNKNKILVIQGDNDSYGSEVQCRAILNAVTCELRIAIVKNCGHTPHFEAKDEYFSEILKYF